MKFYRFNIPLLRSEEKPVLFIKHGSCNKYAITE